MGHKSRATKFEQNIVSFMQKLDFKDVDGARDNFLINEIQVDFCGGHENTLIIGECTMRQQLGKKSVRDKIKGLRRVSDSLEKGFKADPTYRKYKDFRYVLGTKNIDIKKDDIDFANSAKPRVYIWDDNFIDYYGDLYKKIKKYAKYNLLGEMSIRPIIGTKVSVPAFLTIFEKIKMYTFMVNPHELLEVAYVARRETRNERFYQRIVNKEKLNKIARYVDDNNLLPNNLILAFGEHLRRFIKFHVQDKDYLGRCTSGIGVQYGILEFPRDYRSCWIIDGQHRLYAFVNTERMFNMPVTAFENIDVGAQGKYFLDINKNQKPVPPDLVWDLSGDMIPNEEEGIISNTVKAMNEYGPLRYKIYIPSKGIRKKINFLKMAGICLSIKRTRLARASTISKTENPFYNSEPDKLVRNLSLGLSKYFQCVQKLMEEDWKLEKKGFVLDDGGNSVMIRLFEKIVSRFVSEGTPTEEQYEKYLSPIADLFKKDYGDMEYLSKLKKSIASEGGKDELLKKFVLIIKQQLGDNKFGGDIEILSSRKVKELEGRLKELIKVVLSREAGENWFENRAPEDIYKRALKNMQKHGESDSTKAYLQMTIGECIGIMKQYKSLFYQIFVGNFECGFGSNLEFEGAFGHISRIRTELVHDVDLKPKTYDESLFDIYVEKINRCIDTFLT